MPDQQVLTIESRNGLYVAQRIEDNLSWGVGDIKPQAEFANEDDQMALIGAVMESLEKVNAAEEPYSSCTDGRPPVRLLSGESVPVREQQVGCDIMMLFHMAEVLGRRFYQDPNAPLAERVKEIAWFMKDNKLVPSTHGACGAAGGYPSINENLVSFSENGLYVARKKRLLPQDVYDERLQNEEIAGYRDRADRGVYAGWTPDFVTAAVNEVNGDRAGYAIAELKNDGRGVKGHVEEQSVRVKIKGVAINEAKVISLTGGREVFGNNDPRTEKLAELMGRGHDADYRLARMAGEDFTSGGQGTLAKNLPTYVVTLA